MRTKGTGKRRPLLKSATPQNSSNKISECDNQQISRDENPSVNSSHNCHARDPALTVKIQEYRKMAILRWKQKRHKLKIKPSPDFTNTDPLPSQPMYATRQSKLVTNQCSSSTPLNQDALSAQNQCTCEDDDDSCHPTQDSGPASKYAHSSKRGIPATPISVRRIIQETKDAQCFPTRGKRVAEELTAESPLQNKVGCPSGTLSASSNSSASKSWSKMNHCNRSQEVQRSIPMDLSEKHVPQTEVNVAHNDDSCQRSQEVQQSIPMDLSEEHVPQTEVNAAAHNAHSFNLTEAVENMHSTLHDDDEEIESSIDPALVDVQGYLVKPEMAPLLSKIFNEHGDIASNCKVKALREYFLEIVCSLYYKLQNTSFGKIRACELKKLTDAVNELEQMGVNVTWLSKRLDDISSTLDFLKMYSAMKKKELEMKESIDIKENKFKHDAEKVVTLQKLMSTIHQENSVVEEELVKMKAEAEKIQGLRLKASTFLNKCLVDGLI